MVQFAKKATNSAGNDIILTENVLSSNKKKVIFKLKNLTFISYDLMKQIKIQ